MDVQSTGRAIDQEELDFIYELKTGALLEASMMVGAVLAGASDEEVKAVEKIASDVGLAFQIRDDILDVTSKHWRHWENRSTAMTGMRRLPM